MLIGIAGYKQSGKDTMGFYLARTYGFQRHSFAETLKEAAKVVFNLTKEQLDGNLKEVMDRRYLFTGLDPHDGSQLTQVRHAHPVGEPVSSTDELHWWQSRSGEYYPKFLTPRLILTTLGTEWGRRLCTDVWVTACLARVSIKSDHCITDVRFRSEIQRIQDMGGVVIKLTRGSLTTEHQSEKELSEIADKEFDYILDNAKCTVEEFYPMIAQVLPRLRRLVGET